MEKNIEITDLGVLYIHDQSLVLKVKFWNLDGRCNNRYKEIKHVDEFIKFLSECYKFSTTLSSNEKYNRDTENDIIIEIKQSCITLTTCFDDIKQHCIYEGTTISSLEDMKTIEDAWSNICRRFDFVSII